MPVATNRRSSFERVEAPRQELDEDAHGKAAGDVDRHRAPWKIGTEEPQRGEIDQVAESGADAAAKGDQGKVIHGSGLTPKAR